MKRILIAVTAMLALGAGGAVAMDDDGMMAEGPALSLSGSAGLGVNYTGEKKDAAGMVTHESATTFKNFAKVTFKGSGVTDGGLTFGMKVRVNGSGQGGANGAVDDAEVHIGGEMWKITVGDVDQASDLAFSLGDVGFDGDLGVDDIAEGIGNNKANQARVDLTLGAATLAFSVGQQNATAASAGTAVTGTLTTGGLDLSAGQTISFAAEDGEYSIGTGNDKFMGTAASVSAFLTNYLTAKKEDGSYYNDGNRLRALLNTGMGSAGSRQTTDKQGWIGVASTAVTYVRLFETPNQSNEFEKRTRVIDLTGFERQDDGTWKEGSTKLDPKSGEDKVKIDLANEYISYFSLGKDNKIGSPDGEAGNADTLTSDGRKRLADNAKESELITAVGGTSAFDKTSDKNVIMRAKDAETRTIAEDSEAIANEEGAVTFLQGVTEATARKTHWSAGVKAELGPVTFGLGADSDDTIMASVGGGMDGFGGNFFYARQEGANGGADTTGMGAEGTFSAGDGTSVNVVYAQAETGNVKMDGFGLGVTHALGGGAEVQAGLARVNDRDSFSAGVVMSF